VRLHADRDLLQAMHRPENVELRSMIKLLFLNPYPQWALPVEGQPDSFEFYASGFWVRYQVDTSGGETTLRATLIPRPSFG
jgi:hypothetical protein